MRFLTCADIALFRFTFSGLESQFRTFCRGVHFDKQETLSLSCRETQDTSASGFFIAKMALRFCLFPFTSVIFSPFDVCDS